MSLSVCRNVKGQYTMIFSNDPSLSELPYFHSLKIREIVKNIKRKMMLVNVNRLKYPLNSVTDSNVNIFCMLDLNKQTFSQWAERDLNPRPFDYQSNAPPS